MTSFAKFTLPAVLLALGLCAGCQTPQEKELADKRFQMTNERFDQLQQKQLEISEQLADTQQQLASKLASPVTLKQTEPVIPVTKSAPKITVTTREKIGSLNKRYNIQPQYKSSAKKASKRRRSKGASLAAKHIRISVGVREIQKALAEAGVDPGKIDGRVGQKTIAAIRTFQKREGLVVDGIMGPKTWDRLREATSLLPK